jgi:hypothetical protein
MNLQRFTGIPTTFFNQAADRSKALEECQQDSKFSCSSTYANRIRVSIKILLTSSIKRNATIGEKSNIDKRKGKIRLIWESKGSVIL